MKAKVVQFPLQPYRSPETVAWMTQPPKPTLKIWHIYAAFGWGVVLASLCWAVAK